MPDDARWGRGGSVNLRHSRDPSLWSPAMLHLWGPTEPLRGLLEAVPSHSLKRALQCTANLLAADLTADCGPSFDPSRPSKVSVLRWCTWVWSKLPGSFWKRISRGLTLWADASTGCYFWSHQDQCVCALLSTLLYPGGTFTSLRRLTWSCCRVSYRCWRWSGSRRAMMWNKAQKTWIKQNPAIDRFAR